MSLLLLISSLLFACTTHTMEVETLSLKKLSKRIGYPAAKQIESWGTFTAPSNAFDYVNDTEKNLHKELSHFILCKYLLNLPNTSNYESQYVHTFKYTDDMQPICCTSTKPIKERLTPHTQTLTDHSGSILSLAYDPTTKTLFSGSGENTIKVWNLKTHSCIATLKEHSEEYVSEEYVYALAYDPTTKTLFSGLSDNTIKVWDLETYTCIKTLQEHSGDVYALTLDPTTKTLFSGLGDGTINVCNIETHSCIKTLQKHNGIVWTLAHDPTTKTLFSGSSDKTINVCNLETYTCIKTLQEHSGDVYALTLDPTTKTLLSGSRSGTKIWDLETYACIKTLQEHNGSVLALTHDPTTKTLFSGSADKTIKVWRPITHCYAPQKHALMKWLLLNHAKPLNT